jgi:uncharacterized protein (DUF2249 family)/quercetin dioxygenase-like cupin family protein
MAGMTADELDVREVPKLQRHPLIFDRFATLPDQGAFVLVNSHDPKHLRDEFERDHRDAFTWDYLEEGPAAWRVRIGRRSVSDVPYVLCNAFAVAENGATTVGAGALWKLEMSDRHLDANIVRMLPEGRTETHFGPDLDVLLFVLAGAGDLITEVTRVQLVAGDIAWLPRRSQRSFVAGSVGMSFLTAHSRRPALSIGASPTS